MSKVFVLDATKQPLHPVHAGRARILLRSGQAARWSGRRNSSIVALRSKRLWMLGAPFDATDALGKRATESRAGRIGTDALAGCRLPQRAG
jgi:hypothetical protein